MMRRTSHASDKRPEKVSYPPSSVPRVEAWADETFDGCAVPNNTLDDSALSPLPSENGRPPQEWRPGPQALKDRFPSPLGIFEVGERISSGHYGTVYRGLKKGTCEIVAIKKVAIDGHWVVSEFENLIHCRSNYVVHCEGCYYSEEEDMLWLVMEFLSHTLERDLPNGQYLKEEFIAGIVQQVCVVRKSYCLRDP
jgi:serine/threonine protein kinase